MASVLLLALLGAAGTDAVALNGAFSANVRDRIGLVAARLGKTWRNLGGGSGRSLVGALPDGGKP